MVKSMVAVFGGVAESVTLTVKVKLPVAVGVPDSNPNRLRVSPVGGEPDDTVQMYGDFPPLAKMGWL
jgi:hypothetical protein